MPSNSESTPTSTLHRQCKTLLYGHFLEILLEDKYELLIIDGSPSQLEIEEAWSAIIGEYADLIRTPKSTGIFEVHKKLVYTRWKLTVIEQCIAVLKFEYDAEVAEILAAQGVGYITPDTDRQRYLKQVYLAENSAKFLIVLLNQYYSEYKALAGGDSEESFTPDPNTYERELAIITKFMGHRIDRYKISVFTYCSYINLYIQTNGQTTI